MSYLVFVSYFVFPTVFLYFYHLFSYNKLIYEIPVDLFLVFGY